MKLSLPLMQSLNGGLVDTAGFLALQGLFTAHVTGNFVTLGAALIQGTSGATAKLIALPMFCIVVMAVRLLSYRLTNAHAPVLKTLLILMLALLSVAAALATIFGPFRNGDSAVAIVTGMTLVAAMAIQNAVHRVHLTKAPPTTLMTGTSTQIMLDVADLLHGHLAPESKTAVRGRLTRMGTTVLAFAAGCALAAVLFHFAGPKVFLVPPIIAFAALFSEPEHA